MGTKDIELIKIGNNKLPSGNKRREAFYFAFSSLRFRRWISSLRRFALIYKYSASKGAMTAHINNRIRYHGMLSSALSRFYHHSRLEALRVYHTIFIRSDRIIDTYSTLITPRGAGALIDPTHVFALLMIVICGLKVFLSKGMASLTSPRLRGFKLLFRRLYRYKQYHVWLPLRSLKIYSLSKYS